MKKLNVGFTYNVRHKKPSLSDKQAIDEADFDDPIVICEIIKSLELLGHRVFPIEADQEAYLKLKKLSDKLDIVFNYAEGIFGKDREAQIPSMLEMLKIPYTGGSPLSYALGLNKSKCKEIWSYYNIPTPKWQLFNTKKTILLNKLKFPLIAKPVSEGSSKGIYKDNLVYNKSDLYKLIEKLSSDYYQDVLVEEYLDGREFTVAIIGTPPRVLPIIEVSFDELPKDMPKFDHYEAKWIFDSPLKKADPLTCPAKISKVLQKNIEEITLKSFNVLGLKDWARFDVRLDNKGIPNIIEVNCPAGIIPDPKENSRFPRAARTSGLSFSKMLNEILRSACKRYRILF